MGVGLSLSILVNWARHVQSEMERGAGLKGKAKAMVTEDEELWVPVL